jgi:hypothetical protein
MADQEETLKKKCSTYSRKLTKVPPPAGRLTKRALGGGPVPPSYLSTYQQRTNLVAAELVRQHLPSLLDHLTEWFFAL